MVRELRPDERECLQPLFDGYHYLHGSVAGVVHGGMGKAYAARTDGPDAALAVLDFCFLVGDPESPDAAALLPLLQKGSTVVVPSPAWHRQLARSYPGALGSYTREAFRAGAFSVEKLRRQRDHLPAGFAMTVVQPQQVAQYAAELDPALVYNFASHEEFSARGVGFAVVHEGHFVCGVSSAAIGGGKLEFEVQTHPEYRRRGFATATSAAMILYCLEHGLEPCWDAANPASSGVARKLGFVPVTTYVAYRLR